MEEGTVWVCPWIERVQKARKFERCSDASSTLEITGFNIARLVSGNVYESQMCENARNLPVQCKEKRAVLNSVKVEAV
jgi:hypothetical protein